MVPNFRRGVRGKINIHIAKKTIFGFHMEVVCGDAALLRDQVI